MKNTSTLIAALLMAATSFAQWNSINSGLLGQKDHVEKDGTYFLINYPNGVQATTDLQTIDPVNTGLPMSGMNIFAESLGKSDTHVFCGTHDGVYRSDDLGANWTLSNGNIPFSQTEYVKKFYQFNGDVYAVMSTDVGTGGGLYISQNNGNSWFGTAGGMGSNATIISIMEHNSILYANTDVTLYTSSDWGANWTAHPHFNYGVFAFWANNDAMVASTTIGMERSIDGGVNWTTITGPAGLNDGDAIEVLGNILIRGSAGSPGVWISADNGASWAADNTNITAIDQTTLYQFYLSPNRLLLGAITEGYYKGVSLSVEEQENGFEFNAFYNSSVGMITVNTQEQLTTRTEAILYDLTGRTLEVIQLKSGTDRFQSTGLSSGIYLVQVKVDDKSASMPIKVIVP